VTAMRDNTLEEAFGCGTAATIAHIDVIADGDEIYQLPPVEGRTLSNRLIKYLIELKKFRIDDVHGWMKEIR